MNEPARPDQAARVESHQEKRLDGRAGYWPDAGERPKRESHLGGSNELEQACGCSRPQKGHSSDDFELSLLSSEQLAPEALVEPDGRDSRPHQPERRQERAHGRLDSVTRLYPGVW